MDNQLQLQIVEHYAGLPIHILFQNNQPHLYTIDVFHALGIHKSIETTYLYHGSDRVELRWYNEHSHPASFTIMDMLSLSGVYKLIFQAATKGLRNEAEKFQAWLSNAKGLQPPAAITATVVADQRTPEQLTLDQGRAMAILTAMDAMGASGMIDTAQRDKMAVKVYELLMGETK